MNYKYLIDDSLDNDYNTLLEVARAYDAYIQEANIMDRYVSGWRPMSLYEFYNMYYAIPIGMVS